MKKPYTYFGQYIQESRLLQFGPESNKGPDESVDQPVAQVEDIDLNDLDTPEAVGEVVEGKDQEAVVVAQQKREKSSEKIVKVASVAQEGSGDTASFDLTLEDRTEDPNAGEAQGDESEPEPGTESIEEAEPNGQGVKSAEKTPEAPKVGLDVSHTAEAGDIVPKEVADTPTVELDTSHADAVEEDFKKTPLEKPKPVPPVDIEGIDETSFNSMAPKARRDLVSGLESTYDQLRNEYN